MSQTPKIERRSSCSKLPACERAQPSVTEGVKACVAGAGGTLQRSGPSRDVKQRPVAKRSRSTPPQSPAQTREEIKRPATPSLLQRIKALSPRSLSMSAERKSRSATAKPGINSSVLSRSASTNTSPLKQSRKQKTRKHPEHLRSASGPAASVQAPVRSETESPLPKPRLTQSPERIAFRNFKIANDVRNSIRTERRRSSPELGRLASEAARQNTVRQIQGHLPKRKPMPDLREKFGPVKRPSGSAYEAELASLLPPDTPPSALPLLPRPQQDPHPNALEDLLNELGPSPDAPSTQDDDK